ncbi:YceI family protein [Lelliottia nimipressuralis]|uniref:YceI family protein n=1 Tax=Lelliottia nimipressuralis TaxID=69220 RepID=UPI00106ADD00|nr:YceI family protein [Lelliottia nimipressuralis]TFB30401.1 YceI family protein [Lelliottia nimipressuralis]
MLRRLVILLILVCPWAFAAPKSYIIDTDNTAIRLSWHAFGGILSWATFSGITGAVTLNPDNDVDDHIHVTIPVATLVASNKLLTWQLKSDMFFESERYPTIEFISSRVVDVGSGRFRVFGTLTVRNIARPVILEATVKDPHAQAITLDATTAISRAAYGMDKFALVVDDRIAIAIAIQAHGVPSS